ncbi:MAG: phosphotransferase [bacterium]
MDLNELLNQKEALAYIKEETDIFADLKNLNISSLNANTLSVNGFANNLFLIEDKKSGKKVVLKQLLPYVRKAALENVNIPLPEGRIYSEIFSLKFWRGSFPGYVPEVYHFDSKNNIIIFEYIEKMLLLRSALIKGKRFSKLADHISTFLAKTAFYSSQHFLSKEEFDKLLKFFSSSDSIEIWDLLIFQGAILAAEDKNINPYLEQKIIQFRGDKTIIKKTKEIRSLFKNTKESLIHGDFHTSNIFVGENKIKIFDTEFAGYGPPAFDMGRLLGNILLNYSSLLGMNYSLQRKKYQNYLLQLIEKIYTLFENKFSRLIQGKTDCSSSFLEDYFDKYLYQVLSLAALVMIMRIYEEGLCLDFKRIESVKKRAVGQEFVIELARKILYQNKEIKNITKLCQLTADFSYQYQVDKVKSQVLKAVKQF